MKESEATAMLHNNPSVLSGIASSAVLAVLAAFPLPFDPLHWHPLVLWAVKGIGGVIVLQTARRLWDVFVLDKFFPDHRSKPSLLERWRNRRKGTTLKLK